MTTYLIKMEIHFSKEIIVLGVALKYHHIKPLFFIMTSHNDLISQSTKQTII